MKIAVFPGSFDPITNAHVDIIQRALPLFDKIIIAIGINSAKTPMFPPEKKMQMIENVFKYEEKIEVDTFKSLTVSYCKHVNATYILRGIRSVSDFEFENAIAKNNMQLDDTIETIFLVSSPGYSHISSTIVRDILKNEGTVQHLLPPAVLQQISL